MSLRPSLRLKVAAPVITILTALSVLAGAAPASAAGYYSGLVAFEASGSAYLWLYNPSNGDRANSHLGMSVGTSPAMVLDTSASRYTVAFRANNGHLCVYPVGAQNHCTSLGIAAGTSPAIADIPSGGVEVAFEAAVSHHLWLYDSATNTGKNIGLGMAAETSPSIVNYFKNGYYDGFQVAFQANTGHLCVYRTDGNHNICTNLGMAPYTSPSLGDAYDGGVVAFNASVSNHLWLYHYADNSRQNTGHVMAPYTSPSIGGGTVASGIFVAYQGANTHLNYYDTYYGANSDTSLGMATASSPSANVDGSTGYPGYEYEIAFQANNGLLYMYDVVDNQHTRTDLGIYPGTGPSVSL